MTFTDFERAAREAYQAIPAEYKEGVAGLVVSREAPPHPTLPNIFTLGHCLTEDFASDWSGPETTRSQVVLYWGSFTKLAEMDPAFDWEGELWETLTHELRHHLESLAREDGLEGVDYAADETFKRDDGLDFDPWYYQQGEDLGGGVFRVEHNYYVEQEWAPGDFEGTRWIGLVWNGVRYRVRRPTELGDIHYVWINGIDIGSATLELVLVRRRSWWDSARRLLGAYRPLILESEAEAEPSPEEG